MLARFRAWRADVAVKRNARLFDAGWDWAAGELLRGKPIEDIERNMDNADLFEDDQSVFDIGARAAIRTYSANALLEAQYKLFKPIA